MRVQTGHALSQQTKDYIDNMIYENRNLSFILMSEGRIVPDSAGNTYAYEYFIKDHLGNTRAIIAQNSQILEHTDYYPFGMQIDALSFTQTQPENKYLYNGKWQRSEHPDLSGELQDAYNLDWLEYGARMYDAQVGRFWVQDYFSEKYISLTPYQYAANNPILFIDVNGDSLLIRHKNENIMYKNGQLYWAGTNNIYNGKYSKKDGTYKGFIGKTYNALEKIRNGGENGNNYISLLENDNNYHTIVKDNRSCNEGHIVHFNPNNKESGLDQNGSIYSESYIILAHELAHNFDFFESGGKHRENDLWYLFNEEEISKSEIYATHIENLIRTENKLPLREFYSHTIEPVGSKNIYVGSEEGRILIKGTNTSNYIQKTYLYNGKFLGKPLNY